MSSHRHAELLVDQISDFNFYEKQKAGGGNRFLVSLVQLNQNPSSKVVTGINLSRLILRLGLSHLFVVKRNSECSPKKYNKRQVLIMR